MDRRRSYLQPVRDEEAEAQRKARSRRERQSRRSTQGVTLGKSLLIYIVVQCFVMTRVAYFYLCLIHLYFTVNHGQGN